MNFAFVSSKSVDLHVHSSRYEPKMTTHVIRPKRKLHYRKGVTFGISASYPIGTEQVPFESIRSRQSIFRFGFVKKWTRERYRLPKRTSKATCLMQPSNANPRTGNLSIATVDRKSENSQPVYCNRRTWVPSTLPV